jgi:hypothetical protein
VFGCMTGHRIACSYHTVIGCKQKSELEAENVYIQVF